ncbi:MAG: T9SS type A sorting domain-containing protein [Candidatus Kapabacteria bacterium]|nr:T9SS type A sorting domain-containing protein [Candidatus Kapabacteria bacterium]
MKRYLLFVISILISISSSNSQDIIKNGTFKFFAGNSVLDLSKIYVKPMESISKTDLMLSSNDTLNDHFLRATEFMTYAVNVQGNNYPLTGTNPIYYFLGEKFPVSSSGKIEGILIAVPFKLVGTPQDSLVVSIYNSNQTNGLPEGAPIGSQIFFLEDIDTNSSAPKFSYIDFAMPVSYSGPFVLMVLTRSVRVNNNGYVIFSNKHGDGSNQERCCILMYTQNGWVSANLGQLIQLEGVPIDIDPMIIPIVSTGTSGVIENLSLGNFSIDKVMINKNQTELNIILSSLENNPNLILTVVDIKGNVLLQEKYDSRENLLNEEIKIDISQFLSGNYFCIINSGKDKLATKFSIIR